MQQHRIKYFNILLHSFAVANKSLTGLIPEHVLQASDVGSPLDLLFVQIVIEVLHAIGRLAVMLRSSASFAAAAVAEIVGLENIPVVDNTHHAVSAAISGDCKLVHARTSFCCLYDNEKETPQRV